MYEEKVVVEKCHFDGPSPDGFRSWGDWVEHVMKTKYVANVCICAIAREEGKEAMEDRT